MSTTDRLLPPGERPEAPPAHRRAWSAGRHLPFAAVLCLGVALRVLTMLAYRPAFLIRDSAAYLATAAHLHPQRGRPSGYPLALHLVPGWRDMWTVALAQHVLGVAMAVAIYLLLLRRRVPAWAAALAAVPVLLDPLQITVEHYVLTDTLFDALVLAGCVLLLARRVVSVPVALAAGLSVGAAMTVRSAGGLLAVPLVLGLLLGQARWRPVAALLAGTGVCVAAYAGWYHHEYGRYALSATPAHQLYGRVATWVDCRHLDVPAHERALCPHRPPSERPDIYYYTWSPYAPRATAPVPPGTTRPRMLTDFSRRAVLQQPLRYARAVEKDFVAGFAVGRGPAAVDGRPVSWRFTDTLHGSLVLATMPTFAAQPRVEPGPAGFLVGYDRAFHVPGPVLGGCALLAVLAVLGVGRARRSGQRSAVAILGLTGVLLLASAAATAGFSWRYQVPALALLPPAGVLAATAMLRAAPDPDALTGGRALARLLAAPRDSWRSWRGSRGSGRHSSRWPAPRRRGRLVTR